MTTDADESLLRKAQAWIAQHYPGKTDTAVADLLVHAYVGGHTAAMHEAQELQETINYLAKWVERGLFDKQVSPKEALDVIAHHPTIPFNNGRWDVDHKPYAEEFYKKYPKAKGQTS